MPERIPAKILVADDLAEKLLVYQSILEQPRLEIVSVRSGAEALRAVLEHEFAVILLDVNMPGMDGFETAALIRSRKRSAHTPIIFITAHADEVHALRGYSYGAVDYILAPVVPEILRTKVRVFVDLYRLTEQVRQQAAQQISRIERDHAHLSELVDYTGDWAARLSPEGMLVHVNRAGCELLGWPLTQTPPPNLDAHFPSSVLSLVLDDVLPAARRDGVWFGELALKHTSGEELPVSLVVLAHRHPDGALDSFSMVARDISIRKRTEAELRRYREHLEDLVRERTRELNASHEKLRLADRLASIGTLTAGLGHDMGNLLLPMQMRLECLEACELPQGARDDVRAITQSCEYLKRLARGLRMFALNPSDAQASGQRTDLSAWWRDVAPFLKNVLPKKVVLIGDVPDGMPAIDIAPHVLTQAVYNIVQNAGEAMQRQESGHVNITAARTGDGSEVVLSIQDDGPGMPEEVRLRCMEPFFTTKTRSISTGLGLAVVRGVLVNAGAHIDIESEPGKGTAFRFRFPVRSPRDASGDAADSAVTASVAIRDARISAYVRQVLNSSRVRIIDSADAGPPRQPHLHIADSPQGSPDLATFLRGDARRRAVLVGAAFDDVQLQDRVVLVPADAPPSRIGAAVQSALVAAPDAQKADA